MKPWWSMRSGDARQRARQTDGDRRKLDDDGIRKFAKLCKKFKVKYDDRIAARCDGNRLILGRGHVEFGLDVDLYTEFYLSKVVEILARDNANAQSNPPQHPMPSSSAQRDG